MITLKSWPNKKITKYFINMYCGYGNLVTIQTKCLFPIFKSANYLVKKIIDLLI